MSTTENVAQSKKPSNSAFMQQTLKAWQPILTPKTVIPAFFLIGLIFIPIGIALLVASNSVNQITIDYTDCENKNDWNSDDYPRMKFDTPNNQCIIEFEIEEDWSGPVFLYYRLTNFYQNHRRYVKSFDSRQLLGNAQDANQLGNCDPIITGIHPDTNQELPVYPCGLIANSIFNDSFTDLERIKNGNPDGTTYKWSDKGIAWESDKDKFRETSYKPTEVVPPPNWSSFGGKYDVTGIHKIWEDERFMVWMRTAGLPNFRKLWGRNDDSLPAGIYRTSATNEFPVTSFGGTKSIVLSTTSWLGGRNPFLGIAYVVVGLICVALGALFLARHMIKPRELGDPRYLSWNQKRD